MTLGGPPPPDFMPLSAPCEGIPVTFHDNVRHDLSNNTKWTGEMYVMTGIGNNKRLLNRHFMTHS